MATKNKKEQPVSVLQSEWYISPGDGPTRIEPTWNYKMAIHAKGHTFAVAMVQHTDGQQCQALAEHIIALHNQSLGK